MKKRTCIIIIVGVLLLPVVLFAAGIWYLHLNQEALVKEQLQIINEDFLGKVEIGGINISPFERFPYVSIDLKDLQIYENKSPGATPILHINDCYFGFDFYTAIEGRYEIHAVELKGGYINVIQDTLGEINLARAFESPFDTLPEDETIHFEIKSIELVDIHLTQLNEENGLFFDAQIEDAKSKFKTTANSINFGFDSRFSLDVTKEGKPTIIFDKNFDTDIDLDFLNQEQLLVIHPSTVKLENGEFGLKGSIDIDDSLNLDLKIKGNKPNFDLFIAFAPEDLLPTLQKYRNQGKIYFDASISGKLDGGHKPFVEATFGCEEAFFQNTRNDKKLEELFFKGHFTNGAKRDLSTMEFSLIDFSAKPEAGIFKGFLKVKNFIAPEIDMQLSSNFNLEFLADFLNIENLKNLGGKVELTMNFRDIIDLDHPERSLEKLNQSYFTQLIIKDLRFRTADYHLPIKDIDLSASIKGKIAKIEYFHAQVGNSDLSLTASISDLPALIHRTDIPVTTALHVTSKKLDLLALSSFDTTNFAPINEEISDFNMKLNFNSSARALLESPNLPVGKFFVEDFDAKLKNYPHGLHSFDADIFIQENSMRVVNLVGMIDSTRFKVTANCANYDLWFADVRTGKSKLFFYLESDSMKLNNLLAYGTENFMPEEYRHEEFKDFKFKGYATLLFDGDLKSADVFIQYIRATMKIHPLRLQRLGGRFRFANNQLTIDNFRGKLGNTSFVADMTYYLGEDKSKQVVPNHLKLFSDYINFNQLMQYNPPPPTKVSNKELHESAWNIYEIPFPNMSYDIQIDHMHYQKYSIENLKSTMRTKDNQSILFDTLGMEFAGGIFNMKGIFSGVNPKKIYFRPDLRLNGIDLDQLLYRFENFGQDQMVSENLSGKLSGRITGNIRMYPDMVPIIDDSDIDIQVQVTGGRLEHYSALDVMADYFKDKNLAKIIFDTLQNNIQMNKGVLTIPNMTINSSLGFIEVSGKQDLDLNMEYYMRIPVKMVTKAGWSKLFGKEKEIDEDQEDEIQYKDENKKIRYLNIKITGTPDDYSISLGKEK